MHKPLATTAALSVAALTLGLSAPAGAASIGVRDGRDSHHGSDLRSVQVVNGDHAIRVVTTHTNLRRDPATGSAGAVYLDTDRQDRGPEFVMVGGYFAGTDYQLLHTEGFGHRSWGKPVTGSYEMKVDYVKEQVRMRMSRAALGRPGKVRAAVRVSGLRTDGTSVVDWLGEPRSFTRWVARG